MKDAKEIDALTTLARRSAKTPPSMFPFVEAGMHTRLGIGNLTTIFNELMSV
jgi:hypothetical protein